MRLELNIKATQTVTPQIIATMTILQQGAQELEDYLSDLSYENPMMEVEKPQLSDEALAQRLRYLRSQATGTPYSRSDTSYPEAHAPQAETLADHIKEQILTLGLSKTMNRALETAADLLTDRGYYDGTLEELCRLAHCSPETAGEALRLLKTLEPAGVGAGNIQECLLLQLRRLGDAPLAEAIVEQYFDKLPTWSLGRLAKALEQEEDAVAEAKALILTLNPNPGDGFATGEETVYVRPDLMVLPEGDGFVVRAVEESIPKVTISKEYLRLLEEATDPEVKKYLRQKLSQTEQIIRNLSARSSTMVRCAEAVVRWQEEFFAGGDLKKMTLRDIAGELGVHESTVCRTVKHKYMASDRGMLAMGSLFSRDAGQNMGVSRMTIQKVLSQLIANEDKASPYSDQALSELLDDKGLLVSRRTVAKYRSELGIPGASQRKTK